MFPECLPVASPGHDHAGGKKGERDNTGSVLGELSLTGEQEPTCGTAANKDGYDKHKIRGS